MTALDFLALTVAIILICGAIVATVIIVIAAFLRYKATKDFKHRAK